MHNGSYIMPLKEVDNNQICLLSWRERGTYFGCLQIFSAEEMFPLMFSSAVWSPKRSARRRQGCRTLWGGRRWSEASIVHAASGTDFKGKQNARVEIKIIHMKQMQE